MAMSKVFQLLLQLLNELQSMQGTLEWIGNISDLYTESGGVVSALPPFLCLK
jgi:hypothetical protein